MPSTVAAYFGHMNVLKLLLSHGASLNQTDGNGYTVLLAAILGRQEDVARSLLKLGADPNVRLSDGTTPLLLAVQKSELTVVW